MDVMVDAGRSGSYGVYTVGGGAGRMAARDRRMAARHVGDHAGWRGAAGGLGAVSVVPVAGFAGGSPAAGVGIDGVNFVRGSAASVYAV